jgi:hypothetical protein
MPKGLDSNPTLQKKNNKIEINKRGTSMLTNPTLCPVCLKRDEDQGQGVLEKGGWARVSPEYREGGHLNEVLKICVIFIREKM